MKKLLKRIALIALATAVVLFLHSRVKQEMEEAAGEKVSADETLQTAETAADEVAVPEE